MSSKLSNLFFGMGCLLPIFGFVLLGYFFFNRSFMFGAVAVIVSIVVGLALLGSASFIEEKQKAKQLEFLNTFQPAQFDFHRHKSFPSYDLLAKIAIDEQQENVYLWTPNLKKQGYVTKAYAGMSYIINTYSYSDILAINLIEDNYQSDSVQRDTHFTQFLLNKLKQEEFTISNAEKPSIDKISSLDLEIIVDDSAKPKHLIRFYHAPHLRIRKDSPEYEAYFKERQYWFTKLKGIIEKQNAVAHHVEPPIEPITPSVHVESSDADVTTEKTQITVEVATNQYSLHLHEENALEETSEIKKVESQLEQNTEKPKSYFEQLLEKNRRQLHGDYTDDEN